MNRLHSSFFDAPIAHRGLHDAKIGIVENSMGAIKAAVKAGYGIEIDVQPADDQTPMVFHDYLLDRLTDAKGPIKSHSESDLRTFTLGGSSDTIPSLKDVLKEVRGQVPLLIEIKDQDMRLGPNVGTFQDHVCDALRDYAGPVAVMSFSPDTMEKVKNTAPYLPIGLVTDPFKADDWPNVPQERREELATIPDADRLGLDFISHQQTDLSSPAVKALKEQGLAVFCWTIRDAQAEERARLVADNVTFEGYTPARRG